MAQLPPKIPNMSPTWQDFSSLQKMPPNFASPPQQNFAANNASQYQLHQNPSWVDEFLDFSCARRGAHRRSVSDSITFLEAPLLAEENPKRNEESEFDKFDDEQFMSMFTDEIAGGIPMPPTLSSSNTTSDEKETTSCQNNEVGKKNWKEKEEVEDGHHHHQKQQRKLNLKNEADEVESQCKEEEEETDNNALGSNNNINVASSNERITDPKRVKRILANRQSAQRSRVRKLQYISELERSVTSLQAEVSVLSPRVAFLDHQRLLLNVDNSAIKQRIAALAQDKIFKDAHQEALKREIERLRQVYHQQNLKKMENNNNNAACSSPLRIDVVHQNNNNIINVDKEQILNV
ncbi:Basic leucine zipper 61 [Stylosanthes scabra]|uniref:Basic leucine zipper 61 n=1 Tax=Stylosanthes scabra TaxID=79078 RepID=A0ABU6RCZ7_9FABA|nr:Basic leucine zipper 61 [Stylosanthes scabra]